MDTYHWKKRTNKISQISGSYTKSTTHSKMKQCPSCHSSQRQKQCQNKSSANNIYIQPNHTHPYNREKIISLPTKPPTQDHIDDVVKIPLRSDWYDSIL